VKQNDPTALYSYVVRTDSGFAPNPFGNYCTLVCCKPLIRKHARIEDWVVGTGSKRTVGNDKLVYAMKITEKALFEDYSKDPRFQYKIPRGVAVGERGDNIYWKDKNDEWIQRPSYYHNTEKQKAIDLSGKNVLISDCFFYFGANAALIPKRFSGFIKKGPGHKRLSGQPVDEFVASLCTLHTRGVHGSPYSTPSQGVKIQMRSTK
jgi:hypothetical protein